MCRFTLYLGEPRPLSALLTEPENSVINQSFDAEEGALPFNGDGFGVVWYAPERRPEPAAFRALTPAWSNRNLLDLAAMIDSPCVLAHIRAASPGLPVSEANCHPFVAGRLAFMHNGGLAGFRAIRKRMVDAMSAEDHAHVGGTTDSEHLFGLFLGHHRRAAGEGAEGLAEALTATLAQVLPWAREAAPGRASTLNLAVSDGDQAAVTRVVDGEEPRGARTLYVQGGDSIMVSSEPLSEESSWQAVPENHVVLVTRGTDPEIRPLDMP